MIADWKNKNIAVLGLGVEGLSTAKYLLQRGLKPVIFDHKEEKEFDEEFFENAEKICENLVLGKNSFNNLDRYDVFFRSPGVKYLSVEIQNLVRTGKTVTSQTKFFMQNSVSPVIGVTGTKGKGTTSTLIYEMLRKSGFDAHLGGNIGTPPLEFIDLLTKDSRVVLELSSFQLQDLDKSPHIAVMLMITPEHLDYHRDHVEYVDAKRNILKFQNSKDFAILNRDYVPTNESDIFTEGKIFWVSRERDAVEQGCFIKEGAVYLKMLGSEWKVCDIKEISLLGRHNLENVCSSVMAATLAGAKKSDIEQVLRVFTGLPHRLEFVREFNEVKYYDDSFSTTPETAMAAIDAFREPKILILGGSGKNSNFKELGKVISSSDSIRAIIGIGDEWPRIREQITNNRGQMVIIEGAKDMRTIVAAAAKIALDGDVVLLSPACASFGMFKNYKERGEMFKQEVKAL